MRLFVDGKSMPSLLFAKTQRAMKLIVFLLIAGIQVHAETRANKVSLSVTDLPLERVLKEIEVQTGYVFWYKVSMMQQANKVTLRVANAELNTVLAKIFETQPLTYSFVEKNIVIAEKKAEVRSILMTSAPIPPVIIQGKVSTDKGEPLAGVTVTVKGSDVGTSTDGSGQFAIKCSDEAILQFSSVGFAPKEVRLKGKSAGLSIVLTPAEAVLDNVMVIGYGTQSKKEFTGSAANVSGEKLKDAPVQSFDQALAGRAAGVNISQPNGVLNNAPVIRIRGVNSISLSSYPLVVVDGVPINTGEVSANGNVTNNPLADINPADIESISVLKDAASTSIYGSRAAAGVLLITTKKGRTGKAKVTYEGWVGASQPMRLPELLNAEQYIMIKNEAVLNAKLLGGNGNNANVASELFFPTYREDGSIVDTRWYDEVYRTAVSHNHTLGISGGSEATTYYFSVNYTDQDGFIKTNNFNRKAVRFNVNHKATDWIKLGGNISYSSSYNASPNTGSLTGNAFAITGLARLALMSSPNVYAINPDGSYNLSTTNTLGMGNNKVVTNFYNPIPLLDMDNYISQNDHILGTFSATAEPVKGLELKTSYGLDLTQVENRAFNNPVHGPGFADKASATNIMSRFINWDWNNTISYQAKFGARHNASVLAGYDIQYFNSNRWGATRTQAADGFFDEFEGSYGRIIPITTNAINEKAFASVFSRLSYDFGKKYFFTINFRRDGNSALGSGKKYGNFGGVSGGWALSQEEFFKSSALYDVVNNARLRASWGRVGNGNLANQYASLMLYNSSLYGNAPTWNFSQAGNPHLGWETSNQTNVGVDLGLFRDRVQLEATWFNNDINGLILNVPQSPSKGIPNNAILVNVGSMYNRGFEFAANVAVVRNAAITWNASFNVTFIKNRVTALAGGDIVGTTSTAAETSNITRVGYSVGSLYGAITDGVNPETGQRVFINKNGEKVQYSHVVERGKSRWTYMDGTTAPAITAEDFYILGNALPTRYGGFNNNVSLGNFDVNANFTFSGGNYIQNGTRGTLRDQRFWNNGTEVLERWTGKGMVTDVPRLVYGDLLSNGSSWPISANVEKADFIKLKTVSLGYRVPTSLLGSSGISNIRVYGAVMNAFIITNYTGSDPEISSNGNSNLTPGVDKNSAPNGRTFTFGINLGF